MFFLMMKHLKEFLIKMLMMKLKSHFLLNKRKLFLIKIKKIKN